MNFLKRLPIRYKGELHNVKLINFSVDLDEVSRMVPQEIKIRKFEDRAIISMVNVRLENMRPIGLPVHASFDYQHVAFRLLIDDSHLNNGASKGIYFLKSFTNKPLMVLAGSLLSHYKLSRAEINDNYGFDLWQGDKFVRYGLNQREFRGTDQLKSDIAALDRAYAVDNGRLVQTLIQRQKWPIEWVNCVDFKTNFFESAKFLGAFQVNQMIDYTWLPPEVVETDLL